MGPNEESRRNTAVLHQAKHPKACTMAKVSEFPLYTFRHTCLTRWAAHMDPYTLGYLAGHSDFSTNPPLRAPAGADGQGHHRTRSQRPAER
jgi:hypothetical protein